MSTFRQRVQAATNWVKPDRADLPEGQVEVPRKARRAAARPRKRASAPVTAHRLFPAFAAVWFAALFGLGSLAIPGSLLGAVVLKTGLPALVPAAAPPLGFTAHILIAFALAVFGAVLGLALALRLRPSSPAEVRPADVVVPATEPEGEDAYKVRARDAHPDAPPRRPLVLAEAFAEPVSETGPWIPEYAPGGPGIVRPLDLSALGLADPAQPEIPADPALEIAAETVQVEALEDPVEADEPVAEIAAEPAPAPKAPALIAATPQLPTGFARTLPDQADGQWSPVAGAPLESLGIVQLIERLALAIAAQKAANEAVLAADATAQAGSDTPDAEPQAAPEFEASPFSRPRIAVPAADDAASPERPFARPAPASTEAVVPIRPAEPVAAPMSLAAAANVPGGETNDALRSALATLQRMTARA